MSRLFEPKRIEKATEISFCAALFVLPFSIALVELFFTVSFISWTFSKWKACKRFHSDQTLILILGFFLITSSVSAFYSGYPEHSLRGVIKIIKYATICLIAADLCRQEARFKRIVLILLISLSLVVADSMVQRFFGYDIIHGFEFQYTDSQIRLTGPYKFYGLLGANLIALLPVVFSFLWYPSRQSLKNIGWAVLFLTSLYILYKTHSRGAWLASFASFVIYASLMKSRKLFLILGTILIAVIIVLPRNALIHLDVERREQSLLERYRLWERATQVIVKRPLFGCGINTYTKNYPLYDEVRHWRVPGYYAHNGYLQLAAETGLISLFLFFYLIGKSFVSAYNAFKKSLGRDKTFIAAIISGFFALLLQAFMDTTLHNLQSATLIWFFLGICLSFQQVNSHE